MSQPEISVTFDRLKAFIAEAMTRLGLPKADALTVATLMAEAEAWAIAKGFERLSLEVFESNVRARGFYDRLGFRADTIRMVKRIGQPDA